MDADRPPPPRAGETPTNFGRTETRPDAQRAGPAHRGGHRPRRAAGLEPEATSAPGPAAPAPRRLERLVLVIALSQVVLAALVAWVALRR